MRSLLNQLRVRLVLGALVFLLGLTGAVVLVVRDSLQFSARNMESLSRQDLLEQEQEFLLEIVRREAELSDHAVHHNPQDLSPLSQRLRELDMTPNSYAFVVDDEGRLVTTSKDTNPSAFKETVLASDGLAGVLLQMQAGKTAVSEIQMNEEAVLIAFAPMPETGWSLAIVSPEAEVTARIEDVSASFSSSANDILQATLLTIGYFAIIVIIGIVLTARALTSPIQTIVEGTRSIAAGDLTVRIPVKSSDELGTMAHSFNQMAASLQTRTEELTKANQAAIENARLYEQARTLATVEERQRLARELHDSVTQSLYSLTLLAEAGRRTALSGDLEKVTGNIARLGETAQQALKEMRLLVYELRPLALESAGLAEALQHRLDAVEKRAGIETKLRIQLEDELPPQIEHELYRIAQEALNNSLKHAGATAVSVVLRCSDDTVYMEIRDNGKGFNPEEIQDRGGLGLTSIRERIEALGGSLSINAQSGEGTHLMAAVPLQSRGTDLDDQEGLNVHG